MSKAKSKEELMARYTVAYNDFSESGGGYVKVRNKADARNIVSHYTNDFIKAVSANMTKFKPIPSIHTLKTIPDRAINTCLATTFISRIVAEQIVETDDIQATLETEGTPYNGFKNYVFNRFDEAFPQENLDEVISATLKKVQQVECEDQQAFKDFYATIAVAGVLAPLVWDKNAIFLLSAVKFALDSLISGSANNVIPEGVTNVYAVLEKLILSHYEDMLETDFYSELMTTLETAEDNLRSPRLCPSVVVRDVSYVSTTQSNSDVVVLAIEDCVDNLLIQHQAKRTKAKKSSVDSSTRLGRRRFNATLRRLARKTSAGVLPITIFDQDLLPEIKAVVERQVQRWEKGSSTNQAFSLKTETVERFHEQFMQCFDQCLTARKEEIVELYKMIEPSINKSRTQSMDTEIDVVAPGSPTEYSDTPELFEPLANSSSDTEEPLTQVPVVLEEPPTGPQRKQRRARNAANSRAKKAKKGTAPAKQHLPHRK